MGEYTNEWDRDRLCPIPAWALEEIFGLAQTFVVNMTPRDPKRRYEIGRAFVECRKAFGSPETASRKDAEKC